MTPSLSRFVDANPPNVELDPGDPDDVEREFLDGLVIETDGAYDDAFPVVVYTRLGEPVAWVDLDRAVGCAPG
jgi:hypothetical protein